MKLSNDREYVEHEIDIMDIINELQEKHRTVYWIHLYGNIYIYKPLGRKDYKEICENEELTDMDREDEVCKKCLLFPDPNQMDFDDLDAGIVTKLFKKIMENSLLDDINKRVAVIDYYRSEMYDLQNQITCIINEAFPQFDIEEIENWDIERTAKYLSRAEWKLQNFRGAQFNYDMLDQMQQVAQGGQVDEDNASQSPQPQQQAQQPQQQKQQANPNRMTPERLAELKAKFPDINWEADSVMTEGASGMRDAVDTVSPALRVGF